MKRVKINSTHHKFILYFKITINYDTMFLIFSPLGGGQCYFIKVQKSANMVRTEIRKPDSFFAIQVFCLF